MLHLLDRTVRAKKKKKELKKICRSLYHFPCSEFHMFLFLHSLFILISFITHSFSLNPYIGDQCKATCQRGWGKSVTAKLFFLSLLYINFFTAADLPSELVEIR